jgi:hypothetical protein
MSTRLLKASLSAWQAAAQQPRPSAASNSGSNKGDKAKNKTQKEVLRARKLIAKQEASAAAASALKRARVQYYRATSAPGAEAAQVMQQVMGVADMRDWGTLVL